MLFLPCYLQNKNSDVEPRHSRKRAYAFWATLFQRYSDKNTSKHFLF